MLSFITLLYPISLLFQTVQANESTASFHLRPPLPTSQNEYTNWEMTTPGGREENFKETHRDQTSWENAGPHPQIPMPLKKMPQTSMDKVLVLKSCVCNSFSSNTLFDATNLQNYLKHWTPYVTHLSVNKNAGSLTRILVFSIFFCSI